MESQLGYQAMFGDTKTEIAKINEIPTLLFLFCYFAFIGKNESDTEGRKRILMNI